MKLMRVLLLILILSSFSLAYSVDYQEKSYPMCNPINSNFTITNYHNQTDSFDIINQNSNLIIESNHTIPFNKTIEFTYQPQCNFVGKVLINFFIDYNNTRKKITLPVQITSESNDELYYQGNLIDTNKAQLNVCDSESFSLELKNANRYNTAYLVDIEDGTNIDINRSQIIKLDSQKSIYLDFDLYNLTQYDNFLINYENIVTNQKKQLNVILSTGTNCTSELSQLPRTGRNLWLIVTLFIVFLILVYATFSRHKSKIILSKNKTEPIIVLNEPEQIKFLEYKKKLKQVSTIKEGLKQLEEQFREEEKKKPVTKATKKAAKKAAKKSTAKKTAKKVTKKSTTKVAKKATSKKTKKKGTTKKSNKKVTKKSTKTKTAKSSKKK